nr:hypothetical protein [Tanacetum cinerariifolium]
MVKGTLKKSCLPPRWRLLMGQIIQCLGVHSHIQTLEALSGLLNKVTDTLNKFASILNAHNKGVPSAGKSGKSTASPAEGGKNTNPVTEDAELVNLVDLMGIDVVEEYHKKKLLYNQKLEQDKQKAATEIATLKAQSVFLNIQLTEHLVFSMKPEFFKLLSSHDFSSSIPTELKELLSKITALSREVNEIKKHIKEFEIELPEVFNEILLKLKTFSSTVSSITTQTMEALPGLLNKVTDTLNKFASILNAHNKGVPSAGKSGKSTASPAEGKKNTNPVTEDAEVVNLVDLMGIDVVEEYHKKKLL